MPQMPNILFIKHFTRSVVYNIFVATYLLCPPSKHRQRCLALAERKVVPPQVRGPLPPLPLCNFGSVTFHPNSFTCCTFVWSRRLRSITPLYITVPVDPSPPVYRHYSPKCQRRKKVITKMNTTKRGLHIVGKWAPVANASVLFSFKFLVYFPCA